MQLAVERHEHGSQAAPRMRPQDAEPLSVGRGRAHRKAAGALGVVVFGLGGWAALAPGDPCERGLELGLAERGQAAASGMVRRYCGQALLDVAVLLKMLVGEALQQAALDGVEVAPRNQDVGQIPHLVERPRLKCSHELALVDDTRLKCEQSEKKMAIGGGGHGEAPGHDVISGTTDHGPGAPVARGASRREDYRMHVRAVHLSLLRSRRATSGADREEAHRYRFIREINNRLP